MHVAHHGRSTAPPVEEAIDINSSSRQSIMSSKARRA